MNAKAVELFTSIPREYNCAQSVAAAAGRTDLLERLASAAAGRAPEGLCGALFAALQIIPKSAADAAKAEFASLAGATDCRTIKGRFKTPCERCVEAASMLAEKYGGKS